MIKNVIVILVIAFIAISAEAAPAHTEEIEFSFEPSFHDGFLVWLARLPNGKLHCSAYILPLTVDDGVSGHSKSKPKLLKETSISVSDFETIVSIIEGQELRSESEHTDTVGINGTSWTFRRKTGSRTLKLRFWMPESRKNSTAYGLGQKFLALAQLDSTRLPPLSDSSTDIPVIVPSKELIAPAKSKNHQGVP